MVHRISERFRDKVLYKTLYKSTLLYFDLYFTSVKTVGTLQP